LILVVEFDFFLDLAHDVAASIIPACTWGRSTAAAPALTMIRLAVP